MQGTPFPFFVQWHLTERCNLRCRHCYQHAIAPEMGYEATCRGMDNISHALRSWATEYEMTILPSLHLTGGEPFLREDLWAVIAHARALDFSVALMSNGTLINDDIAAHLRQTQVSDVQVSLEGQEETHDRIRGKGSFRRALNGIRSLRNHGITTSINLTLSRLNINQVEEVASLAEELGVGTVAVSRLVPCGRGRELSPHMLTPEELASFYRRLPEIKCPAAVAVSSRDPLATVAGNHGAVPSSDFPIAGCAAGVFGVTITADGSIMPCRRMDLAIGNINQVSFRELWAESPVLWSLRRRQDYNATCRSCRYWAICRGCRAVALASARASGSADYLAPDPQCSYYQPEAA